MFDLLLHSPPGQIAQVRRMQRMGFRFPVCPIGRRERSAQPICTLYASSLAIDSVVLHHINIVWSLSSGISESKWRWRENIGDICTYVECFVILLPLHPVCGCIASNLIMPRIYSIQFTQARTKRDQRCTSTYRLLIRLVRYDMIRVSGTFRKEAGSRGVSSKRFLSRNFTVSLPQFQILNSRNSRFYFSSTFIWRAVFGKTVIRQL